MFGFSDEIIVDTEVLRNSSKELQNIYAELGSLSKLIGEEITSLQKSFSEAEDDLSDEESKSSEKRSSSKIDSLRNKMSSLRDEILSNLQLKAIVDNQQYLSIISSSASALLETAKEFEEIEAQYSNLERELLDVKNVVVSWNGEGYGPLISPQKIFEKEQAISKYFKSELEKLYNLKEPGISSKIFNDLNNSDSKMTELAEKITFIKNNEIYNKFGLEKGIKLYEHLKEKNGIPKDLDLAVLKELGIGKNDDITKIMIAYNACKQLEGLRDFAGTINLMDSQKRQEGLETLQNILIHMSFNNSLYDDDQIPYMKNNTSEFDQADYNLKTQGNLYGAKGSRSTPVKGGGNPIAVGTDMGKLGTVVENPGIKANWTATANEGHAIERMAERGVTPAMADSWIKNPDLVLSQSNGAKIGYLSKDGFVVVAVDSGRVMTAYPASYFDETMKSIINTILGN